MNFYAVLGIPRNADDDTIRTAYRSLARRYHPDRGPGSSTEMFRQVNQAYETLINPGSRRTYDVSLRWTERQSPVEIERMVKQSGSYPSEDARVFGAFSANAQTAVFRSQVRVEELFGRWSPSFDELFFGSKWPW